MLWRCFRAFLTTAILVSAITLNASCGIYDDCPNCPPEECNGDLSISETNPNGLRCKKNCQCNNKLFTGFCGRLGQCISFQRDICPAPGVTRLCFLPPDHPSPCRSGVQTCKQNTTAFFWSTCVPRKSQSERGGDLCNDGIDNDCDGLIDEKDKDCVCVSAQEEKCYTGPAATRDVGNCKSGLRTCDPENGRWSSCKGQVLPKAEECNGVDDNCDGKVDEGCGECKPACTNGQVCLRGTCACPAGTTICDNACVNTQTNNTHCGRCNRPGQPAECTGGSTCVAGNCACSQGQTRCSDVCVNTQTNRTHCGACNSLCNPSFQCIKGKCSCARGTLCGSACVDVETSVAHCGKCNNRCIGALVCTKGQCACPSGQTQCGNLCFDLQSDPAHCGACNQACPPGGTCIQGQCKSCPTGTILCGTKCIDKQTDKDNCGACGNKCTTAQSCLNGQCLVICNNNETKCNDACFNTQTDAKHCGKCNNPCQAGESCQAGTCQKSGGCPSGQTDCSGKCVNLQTDTANCGACGTACRRRETCTAGTCKAVSSCSSGQTDCSGKCVDLQTDSANCGACGNACKTGETCTAGACKSTSSCTTGHTECSGKCVDLQTDNTNCGTCGTTCSSGTNCSAGSCKKIQCSTGQNACSLQCISLATDIDNCGTCGNTCFVDLPKVDMNFEFGKGATSIQSYDIAVDKSGNIYVTGSFAGSFSLTSPTGTTKLDGFNGSAFVLKYSSKGSLLWATKASANLSTVNYKVDSRGIALDNSGNAYVTGFITKGSGVTSGGAKFGAVTLTSAGGSDIFVAKLSSSGAWQWAKQAGGTQSDNSYGVAVDSSGNAYVTGSFEDKATFGTTTLTSSGGKDAFAAKLSTSGAWQWAIQAGGTKVDIGYGIAVDINGNSYLTGRFEDTAKFNKSTSLTSSGNADIWVAKASPLGAWQWATKAGGTQLDEGLGIALNAVGSAYVTGYTAGTANFGNIKHAPASTIKSSVFVGKLTNNGAWTWLAHGESTVEGRGNKVAVDKAGNAFITGTFKGEITFPSFFGPIKIKNSNSSTTKNESFSFIVRENGTPFGAIDLISTSQVDATAIATAPSGNFLLTGFFSGQVGSINVTDLTLSESAGKSFVVAISLKATCQSSQCKCPSGSSFCKGFGCVDLTFNPAHCGKCGNKCTSGQACFSGQCVSPSNEGGIGEGPPIPPGEGGFPGDAGPP